MTAFEVPRGLLRAAIGAVLPHVGTESEHTPQLGRMRFHVLDESLLVWATDHRSSALARVQIEDHLDDGADGFDLPASEAKKVLQVFRPPSKDSMRSFWMEEPMRIELGENSVTFTEAGTLMDGQSLTIRRIPPVGADTYPDVPRLVHGHLDDARAALTHTPAVLDATVLARFASAAKAYNEDLPFMRLVAPADLDVALVQIGTRFLGTLDRRVDQHGPDGAWHAAATWWTTNLAPLRRPEAVVISQALTDDLVTQAKAALLGAADAGGIKLTIVSSGAHHD